jgi:thiamine pyrophosphokinase
MADRFAILLAGELTVTDRLRQQLEGVRVIAADGGIAHAAALGVEPELWIGDFDSSDDNLIALHEDVPRQTHPPAKDATDGELAIAEAVERGAGEILSRWWSWRADGSCVCPLDAAVETARARSEDHDDERSRRSLAAD